MTDVADPITPEEAAEMKLVLESWFGPKVRLWQISRRHYELLGKLIEESRRCTNAMNFVPRPLDFGNPTNWLRKQVRDAVRRQLLQDNKDKAYATCMRGAAYQWAVKFELAGQGVE